MTQQPEAKAPSAKEQRRQRIIEVVRECISTEGIHAVTMRGLAKDSGVATKTLYNQFGSKDAIISLAVRSAVIEVMEDVSSNSNDGFDAFNQLVNYATTSAQYSVSNAGFTVAMIYAYYAADRSLVAFHKDFHDYLTEIVINLLTKMQSEGDLRDSVSIPLLGRQISESLINTTAEWTKGTLSDQALIDMSLLNVLSLLHLHLTDNYADKVAARIRQLHQTVVDDAQPSGMLNH